MVLALTANPAASPPHRSWEASPIAVQVTIGRVEDTSDQVPGEPDVNDAYLAPCTSPDRGSEAR